MKPYLIVAPHYDRRSGGIKSLHRLCHLLNSNGQTAYITGNGSPPDYNVKHPNTLSKQQLKELQMEGVVVYPDYIVECNPLQFTHVVRWFLGITQNGLDGELVFSYSKDHNFNNVQIYDNLMIIHIEDFFNIPQIENRTKKCFYVGKGTGTTMLPETNDCVQIHFGYPNTREELAELFKTSTVFYTYDNLTALTIEAVLCGCPVIILANTVTPKETIINNPFYKYGVGFYGDNIDINKLKQETLLGAASIRNTLLNGYINELRNFIEKTQNMKNEYKENLGPHYHSPHPWINAGFFPDFFSLFKER